ncbi:MAG TPA: alanine racemase [Candidatus Limnocylindria bacterium]|nr:alanine racemase [Candidatus Limnocylindria bacterium]
MIAADRLRAVAEVHGTPAYVYDLDAIEARVRALRDALPARVELAYAVKANPSLAVLATIAATGIGADVASAGELAAVERAGFDLGDVVFTGPGKRPEELELAARLPLRAVTVESAGELDRLATAARRAGRTVPVLLRAAADGPTSNVISAAPGRFGMQPAELAAAARRAAPEPSLRLLGVHRFGASNVRDADALLDAARAALATATEVARVMNHRLEVVDLGGGLGIPYADDEAPLDLGRLAKGLEALTDEMDASPLLRGARWLLEPGRYLVGPCGAYLARVVDTKAGPDRTVVTLDGGIHHLLRPALVGSQHRVRSLAGAARPRVPCLVGGPLCTGLDVLGRAELPEPAVGDLVAVDDAGAYGFTQSMPWFLSHPTPAEVVLRGDRMHLARPRAEPAEVLDRQVDLLTEIAAGT